MTTLAVNGSEHHTGNGSIKGNNSNSDTPELDGPTPALASSVHDLSSQSLTSLETSPNKNNTHKTHNSHNIHNNNDNNDNNERDDSTIDATRTPALMDDSSSFITSLQLIKDLDLFLATAPVNWHENQVIRRYFLNKEEGFVSCVYWNNLYFITGTDIVRCIAYKMSHFGRQIIDRKKFEEGIFSDLRALKCGSHAVLENSRSPFLKFLHRNQCLRTQKKQKVFIWFSVPHEKLFADVLERDLKREIANQPATTKPINDIFKSFKYDQSQPLLDQLFQHFSQHLKCDVSHLLLKSNPILSAATESPKNNFKSEDPTYSQHPPVDNSSLSSSFNDNNSYLRFQNDFIPQGQVPLNNYQQPQYTTDQTTISDDFPLNLLESESAILNSSYLGSNGNIIFGDGQQLADGTMFSPKRSTQYQVLQNANGDSMDIQFMNAMNQPLASAAGYQQQPGNQPMYVLSGLPSAIDPNTTMGGHVSQGHSASFSQFVQLPFQQTQMMHSPSTFLYNGESGHSIDGALFHPGDNQILSQLMRSQSPSISSTNPQFGNMSQSNFIPVYMPVQSVVKEEYPPPVSNNNESIPSDMDPLLGGSSNTSNDGNIIIPKTELEAPNNNPHKDDIKSEQPEEKDGPNIPQSARQDYMMLQVPQLNNVSRVNLGMMNGQLFTPGAFEINPALSAGVGLSPVIGFNNGMLSAIQYQSKHPSFDRAGVSDYGDDADGEEGDTNADDTGTKRSKVQDQRSRVGKPQANDSSKKRFLNPTLQRLQLESLLDEDDEGSDHEDNSKQTV